MASASDAYDFDEGMESDGEESEKFEVFPTILDDGWDGPPPLLFQKNPMRSLDILIKIREAFVKRRPFHSRFAIELYFDLNIQKELDVAWDILRKDKSYPVEDWPYITLTTSPFGHQSKLENIIKTLALQQEILPLSFSSILPGGEPLSLSVSHSYPLIQFHSKICEKITEERIEIEEKYRPDTWIPVCVVAEKVPENRMGDALTALQILKFPISGKALYIRLMEYKSEPATFKEEGANFLFEKEITSVDAMLCRFSVPKEIAENDMFFPKLDNQGSVSIQVWDHERRKREMVLRRYMNYTYHITADWKLPEKRLNLVAGDVILFSKLKRESVLVYPYEYWVRLNGQ